MKNLTKWLVLARTLRTMQSNQPIVSIVIPAYNEEKYLVKTLESVSQIVTKIPFEIIGVNNASTDRTRKVFEVFGIRSFDANKKGLSQARAAGIRAARGEIIIQLDADTVIPETFIDAHHMHYSDEYVVGVSAKVATVGVHPLVYAWCLGSKWFRGLLGEHREVLYGIGSNISYRKNAVMKCLIHYEQHMQRAEDRKMLALLRNQGLVVNASGKTIDIQVSGRKYQTLRQAVAFIGASLMRKIVWRYHKWLPENTVLDDVR